MITKPVRRIQLQILDVLGVANKDNSNDKSLVARVVSGLADEIGMRKLGGVSRTANNCGTSYLQVIRESHIAAHTHYDGQVLFSIVSCKEFDEGRVVGYLKEELELRDAKISSNYKF